MLKGDVSAAQPVLLEASDSGNLRGARTVNAPHDVGISEIQALKARIFELESTHSPGAAPEAVEAADALVATSAPDESVPLEAEPVEAVETANPPVGTRENPEVSENVGEVEAIEEPEPPEAVEDADAPVGTSANPEAVGNVEAIESEEVVETAESPVGTGENPEVSDGAGEVEAIEMPEAEDAVETADAPVATSDNPDVSDGVEEVEAIAESEAEEVESADAPVDTSENFEVSGDVERVESVDEPESTSAETSSLSAPDESTLRDAVAEDVVETADPAAGTSQTPEISNAEETDEVEDMAASDESTPAAILTSDSTASSSPTVDGGNEPDAETSDVSVGEPETAVLAGTTAEAETESDGETASAQDQLLADRTEVLRMRAALKKEKDDIALVKAQLIKQIKMAATKEEELEAKNRAWLAEKQADVKHEAEQASTQIVSAEKDKVDKLEHDNKSWEESNKQLRKQAQQLQEQRDSVVGELRRSVEQNEKMRELMEDIRDDQLRAAGEDAKSLDHAEAADETSDGVPDHNATVFVNSGLSEGDAPSIADTGTIPIGSSERLLVGQEKAVATSASTSAEKRTSPILAVKHISKTGSSTILSLLGRMTDKLPSLYPGHGEFVHYIDELSPVSSKADGGPKQFVISSIRNPCDWYVSLWAFSSQYDAKALSGYSSASDPEPFFGDTSNATKFANWLSWAQGRWSEPHAKSECNAVMSLRYWEALKSGHHVGGINERGYNGATLDKYTQWFDGAPRQRIEDDLKDLSPSKDVDCWVSKENLMEDLQGCLKEYEQLSGVHLDWAPFTEKLAAEKRTADAHAADNRLECEHYYTPELAESVVRHDRHMFEAFGYDSCCGARRQAA